MTRPPGRRGSELEADTCRVCGAPGTTLHRGVSDRLYDAPGTWDVIRCTRRRSCGVLWLDPMPSSVRDLYPDRYYTHGDEEGSARPSAPAFDLWGAAARRYARLRYERDRSPGNLFGGLLFLHPARRAEVDAAYMYLQVRPGARLLDVGSGSGELLQRLSPIGWRPEGVEMDPEAAARARGIGAIVHEGVFEEQGLAADSYDVVTMNHVVEHVPDPARLLDECRRVLRPGGTLVVVTPNGDALGHRMFGRDWFPLETPRHLYLFTIPALRRLATRAGFTQVRARSTIRFSNYFMMLSRRIRAHGRTTQDLSDASWKERVWARALQHAAWAARPIARRIGEEIALIARKPI